MKRRTMKFIEKLSGNQVSLKDRLLSKNTLIVVIAVVLVIAAAVSYLWYSKTYGNAPKITLYDNRTINYEWKSKASSNNIIGDYLFSRTKKLMLGETEDGELIPTYYKIPGRLTTMPAEESGVYELSDQALLLKSYVRMGDRSNAQKLRNRINSEYLQDNGLYLCAIYSDNYEGTKSLEGITTIDSNVDFLDAYLEFYAVYGSSDDYEKIANLVDVLFDDNGMLIKEELSVAAYVDTITVSLADEEVENDLGGRSTLEEIYGSDFGDVSGATVSLDGVKLSNLNLPLIRSLEMNDLLPQGSYERALDIVKGGRLSLDIPYYAYAFSISESGEVYYIYSAYSGATVSVSQSIRTMRYLSEVGELPADVYSNLKSLVMNGMSIPESYYIVTGNVGGREAYSSATDVMAIALMEDDTDLYEMCCNMVGARVATKKSSPALYMVFRSENDRYVFYAKENLSVLLEVT